MNTNKKECGCCGTSKSTAQFHKSPMDSRKFLPICKLCCKEKLKAYTEITGKESAAMWLVLSELGVPFIQEIWDKLEVFKATAGINTDLVMAYLRILNESCIKVDGFWQSDVMLDMLMDSVVDREVEREELDLEEQQRIWGKFMVDGQLDIEAYQFLNQTFDEYTQDLLDMDTNLIRRYRDLAKAELRKRKADESGDIQEIAKAQDSLKKMLDMLNLSDFKKSESDERKQFIDRIAWMIEETEPAEEEDENKYRDIAGYEKIYNDFMRSMRNTLTGDRRYPDIPPEGQ